MLDYFNFSYSITHRHRNNIPATGRVVIVANHPLGALDGLCLLKLVGEVRRDVKIVANDMLLNFSALSSLFLPVDNLSKSTRKSSVARIVECLNNDEAVIVFPAGEVSRIRPGGVRDGKWNSGSRAQEDDELSSIVSVGLAEPSTNTNEAQRSPVEGHLTVLDGGVYRLSLIHI